MLAYCGEEEMTVWEGQIENCLDSGEYDQGDCCLVTYDELYDLVEQAKMAMGYHDSEFSSEPWSRVVTAIERRSNRPLHPCFGGISPYNEFGLSSAKKCMSCGKSVDQCPTNGRGPKGYDYNCDGSNRGRDSMG